MSLLFYLTGVPKKQKILCPDIHVMNVKYQIVLSNQVSGASLGDDLQTFKYLSFMVS
jgi:hypothetical protein